MLIKHPLQYFIKISFSLIQTLVYSAESCETLCTEFCIQYLLLFEL